MKQTTLAFLGLSLLVFCGCVYPPHAEFRPPEGFIFSNYKAPLLVDYNNTEVTARRGDASTSAFHDILLTGMSFGWGDCSADTAAKNGRLNKLGTADYEYLGFCRIFGKTTVHVYQAQ